MLYGAAAAGVCCMTASSGPGISLMQEGMSYLAGALVRLVKHAGWFELDRRAIQKGRQVFREHAPT